MKSMGCGGVLLPTWRSVPRRLIRAGEATTKVVRPAKPNTTLIRCMFATIGSLQNWRYDPGNGRKPDGRGERMRTSDPLLPN